MRFPFLAALAALQLAVSAAAPVAHAAAAAAPAAQAAAAPQLAGEFRDWFVYTNGTGANKICYALSQPKGSEPRNVQRGMIFFLITNWPAKNKVGEPSIVPGYTYKEMSAATVQIGNDKFDFFTTNEATRGGAWVRVPAEEKRLTDAMKKGSNMIVTGTSSRGTLTKDTYSLAGITAALDAVNNACK